MFFNFKLYRSEISKWQVVQGQTGKMVFIVFCNIYASKRCFPPPPPPQPPPNKNNHYFFCIWYRPFLSWLRKTTCLNILEWVWHHGNQHVDKYNYSHTVVQHEHQTTQHLSEGLAVLYLQVVLCSNPKQWPIQGSIALTKPQIIKHYDSRWKLCNHIFNQHGSSKKETIHL